MWHPAHSNHPPDAAQVEGLPKTGKHAGYGRRTSAGLQHADCVPLVLLRVKASSRLGPLCRCHQPCQPRNCGRRQRSLYRSRPPHQDIHRPAVQHPCACWPQFTCQHRSDVSMVDYEIPHRYRTEGTYSCWSSAGCGSGAAFDPGAFLELCLFTVSWLSTGAFSNAWAVLVGAVRPSSPLSKHPPPACATSSCLRSRCPDTATCPHQNFR